MVKASHHVTAYFQVLVTLSSRAFSHPALKSTNRPRSLNIYRIVKQLTAKGYGDCHQYDIS
jgi:hypothetical protein